MTRRIISIIISALLLIAAMPPFDFGNLAWFALLPFMYAVDGLDEKRGAIFGYVFGLLFFLGSVYWVVNSMYNFGGVPLPASVLVMLLLVAYLSIFPALFGIVVVTSSRLGPMLRILIIPSGWVTLEFLRGYLLTGLPWSLLGYTQTWAPYVPQVADITGVWGLSFLVVMVNVALYMLVRSFANSEAGVRKAAIVTGAVVVAVVIYGVFRVQDIDKKTASWKVVRAAVAQGNIEQSLKWDASFGQKTIDIYADLSRSAASAGARLIIWPETAVPFYLAEDRSRSSAVEDVAKDTSSYILTGSPSYQYNPTGGEASYYNSAYLLSPAEGIVGRYDKIHLVPFGEFVPLKGFLPFVKKLTSGVGDFSVGRGPDPIRYEDGGLGVLICFESIFPDIGRLMVKNGATLLVNITNDAWFGKSSAPYQHFQMSVMRAIENRVYYLRSANTGISAIIGPTGAVMEKTGLFERAVKVGDVRLRAGSMSFYTAFGDVFLYFCMFVTAMHIVAGFRIQRFREAMDAQAKGREKDKE